MRSSIKTLLALNILSILLLGIANAAAAELFTLDYDNNGVGEVGGSDDRPVSFVGTVTTVNGGAVDAAVRAVDLTQVDPLDLQAEVQAYAGAAPDFLHQDVFIFDVIVNSPSAPIDQILVGIGTGTQTVDPVSVGYFADGLETPSGVAIQSGFALFPGGGRFDFSFGAQNAGNLEAGETSVRLYVAYVDSGLQSPLNAGQVANITVSSGTDEDFQSDIGTPPASLALMGFGLLALVAVRRRVRTRSAAPLLRCGLVAALGLSIAPVAHAAPDISGIGVVNEDDGLLDVCDAPCFSLQISFGVYFPGNLSDPTACPAGDYAYVYTLEHLGGSGTKNGGTPGGLTPALTQFEVEADAAVVTTAGFIPGPDASPLSTIISPLGVVTWGFSAIPVFPAHATNPLFLCSPSAPGTPLDSAVSAVGTFLAARGRTIGPLPPPTSPEIDVVPPALDFGDVDLGATNIQIVTITNVGTGDLTLGTIDLGADSDAAFAIDAAPASGSVLAPNASADVELDFTPVGGTPVTGTLEIASDDADEPLVEVALSGRGVPLDEQVMEILDFFDQADLDSTQGNRDLAMRNLLETAGDFIDRGQIDQACHELADALERVDGIEPPDPPPTPDFVDGPDAEALAAEIAALRDNLDCDAPKVPPGRCGIGFELAFVLPPLMRLRRRRRLAERKS